MLNGNEENECWHRPKYTEFDVLYNNVVFTETCYILANLMLEIIIRIGTDMDV